MSATANAPADDPARLLRVEPAPHWHGGETLSSATWVWIIAAAVPAVAGLARNGAPVLAVLAVTTATALLAESVLARLLSASLGAGPRSDAQALLTGVLVALTLPAGALQAGWTIPVTAASVAVLIRLVLGGYGNYLWNPVAVGRVVVELLFADRLRGLSAEGSVARELAALGMGVASSASASDGPRALTELVRDTFPPWHATLWGTQGGAVTGELIGGSAVAVMLAGLLLAWRGQIDLGAVASALMAALVAAVALPIRVGGQVFWLPGLALHEGLPVGCAYALYHLTAGELLLVVWLLQGDSVSRPLRSRGRRWFGAGLGVLIIVLRLYGLAATAGYWALLAMNTLVPFIDRATRRRVYGTSGL